jgi:two-component system chemotaxis response regulator CheB
MTGPIRVLVVDDSITVRKRIVSILAADPALEVVGEAADGTQAVALCHECRPDVVTLDLVLPGVSGITAIEHIMVERPTPILVVSSATNRAELVRTYDALAAGALDVLDKPAGGDTDAGWALQLVATVKLLSRVKVISHPRARLTRLASSAPLPAPHHPALGGARPRRVVAIGASTGGPAAVATVLRQLPRDFDVPVLLVVHINEPFGTAFAEWLSRQVNRVVRYPKHGDSLSTVVGQVAMAPPGRHLELVYGQLWLTDAGERHSCRPSVDVLFESLARHLGRDTAACLLTGMGRDGAEGLLALRRAGALTIAQDEASCVVYGMPREAAALDAATLVLPLDLIGPTLAAVAPAPSGGARPLTPFPGAGIEAIP